MPTRTFPSKRIRPLSKTTSAGVVISPTKELRALKVGRFFVVDDAKGRRCIINAAHRLNISISTRKQTHGSGYEIHRVAKPAAAVYDFPNE